MNNIIIYLGSKCNLNCKYCHRENEQDIILSKYFLKELSSFNGNIIFRGGEPTLYMDTIKKIVSNSKKAQFSITTNGIELNKHINYFKEHNFHISISYDGNDIRQFDPYTNYINYPSQNLSNTIVLTRNMDIFNTLDVFDEKSIIIGKRILLAPHIGHYTNKENKEYAMLEEDYEKISSQLKKCMNIFVYERKKYHTTNNRYYGIYTFFNNYYRNNFSFGETVCANHKSSRVDLSGQRYNCLYIRDQKLGNEWLQTQQSIIREISPKCERCEVYDMCGAGCLKSLYHNKECKFYKDIFTWYKIFYKENINFL